MYTHPASASNTSSRMRVFEFQPARRALAFMITYRWSPMPHAMLASALEHTILVRMRVRKPSSDAGNLSSRYLATTKLITASPMNSYRS